MLGQMMQVGFYGHVRQYKNIQAEIDANIKRVIESGEYVQGPMLKQFEQELAAFHGTAHAIGAELSPGPRLRASALATPASKQGASQV